MDSRWQPTWDAHLIDWPDFGLPKEPLAAAQSIDAAFERAKKGERFEIGCAGGLGRTGTVLGCMAVLAGVPTPQAVRWVRENYHQKAIETPEQQAWISWFAERVAAGEVRC
jgi:protein-tyrosine phosphatase